jgi:hypothetical protein
MEIQFVRHRGYNFIASGREIRATDDGSIGKQVKVKEARNRPGVAQRVPGVLGSQIS